MDKKRSVMFRRNAFCETIHFKGVVTKYVGQAVATGLDWPAVAAMDEATLERRLLAAPRPSDAYAQASYGRIHQELRRKDMTSALPREEYSESGMPHR